jgi:hypothetical protein
MDRDEEMGHGDRSLLFIGDEDDDLAVDRDGAYSSSSDGGDGQDAPDEDDDESQQGEWPQSYRFAHRPSSYLPHCLPIVPRFACPCRRSRLLSDPGVARASQAVGGHEERGAVADDELNEQVQQQPHPERELLLPQEGRHLAAAAHAAAARALAVAPLAAVSAAAAALAVAPLAAVSAAAAAGGQGVRGQQPAAEYPGTAGLRDYGEAVEGVPQVRLHRAPAAG